MTAFQATMLLLAIVIIMVLVIILWLSIRREAIQASACSQQSQSAGPAEARRCCNFNCRQGRDCPLIRDFHHTAP